MLSTQTYDRYEIAAQEDRCAPRTQLNIAAMLRPSGDKGFSIMIRDLSLGGFACEAVTGMRPGALCWLTIPSLSGLQAKVIWNNGAYVGCEFAFLLNPAVHESVLARYG